MDKTGCLWAKSGRRVLVTVDSAVICSSALVACMGKVTGGPPPALPFVVELVAWFLLLLLVGSGTVEVIVVTWGSHVARLVGIGWGKVGVLKLMKRLKGLGRRWWWSWGRARMSWTVIGRSAAKA